jgi:hypothetical protein
MTRSLFALLALSCAVACSHAVSGDSAVAQGVTTDGGDGGGGNSGGGGNVGDGGSGDGGDTIDATDWYTPNAHCCYAAAEDAALYLQAVSEPCWDSDPAGNYARWKCADGTWCANNGLSCNVGDPCTFVDIQDRNKFATVVPCVYPGYPEPD